MTNGADETWSLDKSEELDQLQQGDTLDDRGVDDILDEGIVTREHWGPGEGFGNTSAEMRQGETLEQRIAQEEPDVDAQDWNEEDLDDRQVGDARAGRLVAPDEGSHTDTDSESFAYDIGIDGAGATAEEAAMHVIPDDEEL